MNRKMWIVGFCGVLILGLLGYGFLSRGGDRVSRRVERGNAPERAETASPTSPVETTPPVTGPEVSDGEKKGASFQIRVLWLDTNQPVEGATVTLIPEPNEKAPGKTDKTESSPKTAKKTDKPEDADKSIISLTGQTDKAGNLSLECPSDLATTGTLRCQVKAEHPGAASLFYRRATVSTARTLILTMKKTYGYFGTVYRRGASGQFVPAPAAKVSAVVPNLAGTIDLANQYLQQSSPVATVCDAQGHYEFSALPENIVYLWGQLDDQVTVEVKTPVMAKPGERNGPFDIYLEKGASLTALVSDKTTLKSIPNATVEVKFAGNLSCSAPADAEGFCEVKGLPLGRIEVIARAEGYANEFAPMEITPDANSNVVPFFLDKGGRVRILTVDNKNKKPLGNVPIELWGNGMTQTAVSDSEGIAVVEDLRARIPWTVKPTGEYSCAYIKAGRGITADIPRFSPDPQKTVEVTLNVSNKVIVPSEHSDSSHLLTPIEGTVVNEAGEPLPGTIVTARSKCCRSSVVTDSAGDFRIENACVGIYPASQEGPLPDLAEWKGRGGTSAHPGTPEKIDLAHSDYYLPREGHINEDGSSVPYYVGPATLQIKADGFVPLDDYKVPIDRKAQIVLKDKTDGVLKIRVLDAETKKPITDYWLMKREASEMELDRQEVCSRDGEIVLRNLRSGRTYGFLVAAKGYITKPADKKIGPNEEENQIEFLLDKQIPVDGVILNAQTQQPLSGVEIRFVQSDRIEEKLDFDSGLGAALTLDKQISDSKGEFHFKISTPIGCFVFIPEKDFQIVVPFNEIEQYRNSESGKIVIPIEKHAGSLEAMLFIGKEPYSRDHIVLTLNSLDNKKIQSLPVIQGALYRWENLQEGWYELASPSPQNGLSWGIRVAFQLSKGEKRILHLGENESSTLLGRVLDSSGKPVPSVVLEMESTSEVNGERKIFHASTTSNGNGFYAFDYLANGEYRIRQSNSSESKTIRVEGKTTYDFVTP